MGLIVLIAGVMVYNDILFMPLARKYLISAQETVEVEDTDIEENEPLLETDGEKQLRTWFFLVIKMFKSLIKVTMIQYKYYA